MQLSILQIIWCYCYQLFNNCCVATRTKMSLSNSEVQITCPISVCMHVCVKVIEENAGLAMNRTTICTRDNTASVYSHTGTTTICIWFLFLSGVFYSFRGRNLWHFLELSRKSELELPLEWQNYGQRIEFFMPYWRSWTVYADVLTALVTIEGGDVT